MKVSIIVPVYNCEKYLKRCIESVINQTYKDWELILIDDGSTDKSYDICLEYKKKYKNIIALHQDNKGVGEARNYGIEKAIGKYCMFIDGDDYIEQETLNILSNEIKKNDYQIIFYGNYNYIFSHDRYIRIGENKYKEYEFNNNEEFKKIYIELFNKFLVNQVWNKIYKKSFIDEIGISFPKEMNYSEDIIFNIKLYKNLKKGKVLNKSLYNYINHKEDSLCTTFNINKFNDMKYAYIKINQETKDWNRELANYLNNAFIKDINIFINSLYSTSCNLTYSKKREVVKKISNDDVVQNCINISDIKGIRNEITSIILKNKLVTGALLMGKVISLIKKLKHDNCIKNTKEAFDYRRIMI